MKMVKYPERKILRILKLYNDKYIKSQNSIKEITSKSQNEN